MNTQLTILNFLKFLIYGTIMYTAFRYIPKDKLPSKEIMIILALIILIFICIDIIPFNLSKIGLCNCNKEHFVSDATNEILPEPQKEQPVEPPKEQPKESPKEQPKEEKIPEINEMKYTTQDPNFYEKLGDPDQTMSNGWKYGYSYLNTDKWTVPQPRPPVCVQTGPVCPVCPVTTSGYGLDLMEFNGSTKISTDNINTKYIKEVLNTE